MTENVLVDPVLAKGRRILVETEIAEATRRGPWPRPTWLSGMVVQSGRRVQGTIGALASNDRGCLHSIRPVRKAAKERPLTGRNRRLQAKSAFWRSPSVHPADLGGPPKVRFCTFPNRRRITGPAPLDDSESAQTTLEIAVFYVAIGHSAPRGAPRQGPNCDLPRTLFSVVRARRGPRPVWRTTPSLRAKTPRLDGTHRSGSRGPSGSGRAALSYQSLPVGRRGNRHMISHDRGHLTCARCLRQKAINSASVSEPGFTPCNEAERRP